MVKNEIKVFARLRPELKRRNVVNYEVHRRPRKHVEEDYLVLWGAQKSVNEVINNRPDSWNFAFHKIFDHSAKQDEVFEDVAKPVIQSVLNGYNATIFAYGQTGSGKTFSITGDSEGYEDRGILPRTIEHLFQTIQQNPESLYSVEIAYLEIYNENGYDLLDPKHEVVTKLEDLPRVTIQEDEAGRLHLKNLSFRVVDNEKDALALLFLGDTKRAIAETPMNPQSSRSHCIFTIVVSVREYGAEKYLKKAKMHLVDLAGSERVYKCCISGSILTEAKHINLSLHYLEQVIVCLGQQNVNHIPYRNSLLTAILRDSLGGNCLTTMLATLSINKSNLEETISTCRFSQRVALIRNDVNLVFERNAEDENKFLKMEVERLRNQLALFTKQPENEELTPSEKQDLDYQVEKFLQSDFATIDWKNDARKIRYCLNTLRSKLRSRNEETGCLTSDESSEKDVNYYRNLVIQRDKEISALVKMLEKARRNSSNNSANDSGSFQTCEKIEETSPTASVIAKKVRLGNLIAEAKSVAELIRIGKASIADLRRRMSEPQILNGAEIHTLHKVLQGEQSRLSDNLTLLKSLKSELTDLKSVSSSSQQDQPTVKTRANAVENLPQNSEPTSRRDPEDLFVPVEELISARLQPEDCVEDKETNKVPTAKAKVQVQVQVEEPKSPVKPLRKTLSDSGGAKRRMKVSDFLSNNECLKLDDDVEKREAIIGTTSEGSDSGHVGKPADEPKVSRSSGSKRTALTDQNRRVPNEGDNFGASSTGQSSTRAGASLATSSFLPPKFLQDLLRSVEDSELRSEHQKRKENVDDSAVREKSFSESPSNREKPDEKDLAEPAGEFRAQQVIPNPNDGLEEDDDFMKSLPLTGDPEIDEEIIAFYRAKRSGGTY